MNSSFFNVSKYFYIIILVLCLLICIVFIPILEANSSEYSFKFFNDYYDIIDEDDTLNSNISNNYFSNDTDSFLWPVPGYSKISSKFGKRSSPTKGASTFHTGIDIPASPRN